MIENEAKGWYGCYSKIGKQSAEKYFVVTHKDEIFNREFKTVKTKDLFTPDSVDPIKFIDNNLEVFKIYNPNEKIQNGLIKRKKTAMTSIGKKNYKNNIRLKYHYLHCICASKNKIKNIIKEEDTIPSCTRYNPKHDLLHPKLITGPKWKDRIGRIELNKREIYDYMYNEDNNKKNNENYYDEKKNKINNDFTDNSVSKCLVDMNKATQRGESIFVKDLRIRTDKAFHKKNKKHLRRNIENSVLSNNNINNNILDTKSNYTETVTSPKKTLFNNIKKNTLFNNIQKSSIKKKYFNKTNMSSFYDNNNQSNQYLQTDINEIENDENAISLKKNLKGPDFSKIISREYYEKIDEKKIPIVPFILPNYTLVRERPLTMAKYEQPHKSKNRNKNLFLGIDLDAFYSPDKQINKYNNHTCVNPPDFNIMTSRKYKKGSPLPSFMQDIHDRFSLNNINNKSLDLNNFSDGKFLPAPNTFFPKKSFNNVINLSYARSKKFKEKDLDEDIENKKYFLKTQISFSHTQLEKMLKEGSLNKFDNVTFRSIDKRKFSFLNLKQLDKCCFNFDINGKSKKNDKSKNKNSTIS